MEEQVSKGRLLRRVDILRRQARRARRLAEGFTNANDRDPLLAFAIDADAEADGLERKAADAKEVVQNASPIESQDRTKRLPHVWD